MSYMGIGADDPNHPLEVEGQVFISNVEQGSTTNEVPFEVYSDYSGITGDILEGARQMRLRVTPSATTSSNVNIDMGIEPISGSYFYISNPVIDTTLGSNTAFRIVQAGHVEIGSNLSVSGNVVASNIIGGSPLTLSSDSNVNVAGSGGLLVTGPVNVGGTISSTGAVSGTSATYTGEVKGATVLSTGQVVATGSLRGASLTVTGDVQGTTASLGAIDGSSLSVSGAVQGSIASLGGITGSSLSVSGDVQTGASFRVDANNGITKRTGDYGSVQTFGNNSWDGYSINGNHVFMASATQFGLYDDINSKWGILCTNLGKTELHYAGVTKLSTTSVGVNVTGTVSASEEVKASRSFLGGTSGDTSRAFSHLSNMGNGTVKYIAFGEANSDKNQAELSFYTASGGNAANYMGLGLHSRNIMYLTGHSRVGIGLTNPTYTLEVNGSIKGTSVTAAGGVFTGEVQFQATNTSHVLYDTNQDWYIRSGKSAGKVIIQDIGGNVGIGIASPSYKLHVNGDIYANWVRVAGTSAFYFQSYGGGWFMQDNDWIRAVGNKNIYTAGSIHIDGEIQATSFVDRNATAYVCNPFGASQFRSLRLFDDKFYMQISGAFPITWHNEINYVTNTFRWINSTHGTAMYLYPYGSLYIDGTYNTFSDGRLKDNIVDVDDEYALNIIKTLKPKKYTLKKKIKRGELDYGFIADEVEEFFPEMVTKGEGCIPIGEDYFPGAITSKTSIEVTVTDGTEWDHGDKIVIKIPDKAPETLTVYKVTDSVLSLTSEKEISDNIMNENNEIYINGKSVEDLRSLKVSYLDPLIVSAIQQLERRVAELENKLKT